MIHDYDAFGVQKLAYTGREAKAGEIIGYLGDRENADTYHLHIEITVGGGWIAPFAVFPDLR